MKLSRFPIATAATSILVISVVAIVWIKHNKRFNRIGRRSVRLDDDSSPITENNLPGTDEQLEVAFQSAADMVRKNSEFIDDEEMLVFYALYKQAKAGDAPKASAFGLVSWNVKEYAKRAAWEKMRGMPISSAKLLYISAAHSVVGTDGKATTRDDSEFRDGSLSGTFAHSVSLPQPENGSEDEDEADENATTVSRQGSKLLDAASKNDFQSLSNLLDDGVSPDFRDKMGQSALHLASDKGSVDCVNLLLAKGANINSQDNNGVSALQTAVVAGQLEICRLLLQQGADPNLADEDGDTPETCAKDDNSTAMKSLFKLA